MKYDELRERVLKANNKLVEYNLVTLTWGNASEIDRENNIVAIKPSGVNYAKMVAQDIVIVDLEGNVIDGKLNPSSDLPTHLYIYKMDNSIKSVVHTHSVYATATAQAGVDLEVYGTTQADYFYGAVPCTRIMRDEEILSNYEHNTGVVIGETFNKREIDPTSVKGVLVNNHGPFVWGSNCVEAVENALIIEVAAKMNFYTKLLNANVSNITSTLLDKHYLRKHGENSYYGQKT